MPAFLRLDRATGALALSDGAELRIGKALMRITAPTEGILRVRIAADEGLPRDESWAVLPEMQRRSVQVAHYRPVTARCVSQQPNWTLRQSWILCT